MQSALKKKKIGSPTEIICSAASYITYWAGLKKMKQKLSWRWALNL
jgi:hypothetical protein